MTGDSMKQLQELAAGNSEVLAALRAAATREAVVEIAADNGIELDGSELIELEQRDVELSDADLESSAGGGHPKYSTFDYACP